MSRSAWKPYIGLAAGVFVVSWASIFIRLADAPALVVGAYRLALASLLLSPFALLRVWGELRRLTARDKALAVLSGAFLGLHFATWIASLEYTTVASSVVLVSTHPLFVSLASHFILRERVSRARFLGIALAILGSAVIGLGDFALSLRALWGDLLALIGAMAVSGYFLIGRDLRRRLSLTAYIFPTYWTAAIALLASALLSGHRLVGYSGRTYLMFLLLALGPQLAGHSSLNWALRYLSPIFVTVAVLGEPVVATILAYFILGEVPGALKLAGGALVLGGIYIVGREEQLLHRRRPLKYILFDLDETLYPRGTGLMEEVKERVVGYMTERMGMEREQAIELRRQYFLRYGTTMCGLILHHGIDPEDYLNYVHRLHIEKYIVPNGKLDAVLARIPLKKAVFTNASLEHARRVLRLLGIERHFSHIVDIRALGYVNKPDVRAYRRVLEILGVKPEECVVVEDMARNLRPAKELGMVTVLVDGEGAEWVDFVIQRVEDIGEVINQLV